MTWETHRITLKQILDTEPKKRTVEFVDGEFVFAGCKYAIPIERAKTHAQILEWVHHIAEKPWATGERIADFIQIACAKSKLKLY